MTNALLEDDGNFRVGTVGSVFVRTNNKAMAEKCAKLADDLIHNSEFIRRAEGLSSRKSEVEGYLKTFGESLDYIARDRTNKQATRR
jgi:hypothetical protein